MAKWHSQTLSLVTELQKKIKQKHIELFHPLAAYDIGSPPDLAW